MYLVLDSTYVFHIGLSLSNMITLLLTYSVYPFEFDYYLSALPGLQEYIYTQFNLNIIQ